jgi:hypothetical protein
MPTRAEFLEQFRTPPTTGRAYNFGKASAFFGHGRLSFAEFFANPMETSAFRSSLYRAYRKGFDRGLFERRRHLEKLDLLEIDDFSFLESKEAPE